MGRLLLDLDEDARKELPAGSVPTTTIPRIIPAAQVSVNPNRRRSLDERERAALPQHCDCDVAHNQTRHRLATLGQDFVCDSSAPRAQMSQADSLEGP